MDRPTPPTDADLFADVEQIAGLGPRFPGTTGEERARAWLSRRFDGAGLSPVRREPLELLGYSPRGAACRSAAGDTLPCSGLQYTANAEARGSAIDLGAGTDPEIAAAAAREHDLAGRVAVVRGLPFGVVDRLAPHGVAALVHIGETQGGYQGHFTAAFWPPSLTERVVAFPGVSVQPAAGARLLAELAAGPVELTVRHHASYPLLSTANVVGELRGTAPDGRVVVVGAHYDTQFDSPGASDNATGLATLLGIARAWRSARPRRSLLFVAFAAEELGAWGATAFLAARDPREIRATVNVDALGSPVEAIRMLVATPGLAHIAHAAAASTGWTAAQEVDAREFLYTDNAPFAVAGVETCLLWRLGPSHPYYHSAGDVPAHVSSMRLGEDARAVAAVTWQLATD